MISSIFGQPVQYFRQHSLPIVLLFLVATTGIVLAELPQRGRSLTYQPLTSRAQTPAVFQSRTLNFEPVRRQNVSSQRYAANYPVPESQETSASSFSSDRDYGSSRDEMLPLPPLGGPITDPDANKFLNNLKRDIVAAKTGNDTLPGGTTQDNVPLAGNDNNTLPTPGTNSGPTPATRIFQDTETNDWYARIEGSSRPLPLAKSSDGRYFQVDDNGTWLGEVVLRNDDSTDELAKDGTKSSLADDQTRNAVMLIVTVMAVLAALSVGFLALDYKNRWEQEIVSQNSRLLGNGTPHGGFSDLDSLEPETLRFSPHDYRPLDDSFDHSFRTIA